MNFSITSKSPKTIKSLVITTAFEGLKLTNPSKTIDELSGKTLRKNLRERNFSGKLGQAVAITNTPGIKSSTVLVVGLGVQKDLDRQAMIKALEAIFSFLKEERSSDATLFIPDQELKGVDLHWLLRQIGLRGTTSEYQYQLRTNLFTPRNKDKISLTISVERKVSSSLTKSINQGAAIGKGVNLARDLGNLPANVCTPTFLAQTTEKLGKRNNFKVKTLNESDMEKLGMGSFLSVSNGSDQPAKLIHATYSGGDKKSQPIVLIGKGITFDTGGISLKPSSEMDEMKYDMCGAASVIGTMLAISEMKLPINVVGLVAAAENMPSGRATRPGDVVKTMSGKTVEILNTDAEGRLVLCDTLTYAEQLRPKAAIDVATLTGACVVSLGKVATGLFSNNDVLSNELTDAGNTSWDRVWRMPIWDDYNRLLESNFADLANIGGRAAGSITAACFLSQFATSFPWAHLDIAGTAWVSGKNKGSTGRPVPLLCEYLMGRANI